MTAVRKVLWIVLRLRRSAFVVLGVTVPLGWARRLSLGDMRLVLSRSLRLISICKARLIFFLVLLRFYFPLVGVTLTGSRSATGLSNGLRLGGVDLF